MAQITLPTTEPLTRQKASPGEFASYGATVAEMGNETANLALANEAFEGHLIYAQRQLTLKHIEIGVQQLENQAHEDLSKAVTPEDAQAIHAKFKEQVDGLLTPYMGDSAMARELGVYGQQVDVTMQHNVNAKKADIITKNGRIADTTLGESAKQEAINIGAANGSYAGVIAAHRAKLEASVSAGIWTPQQVDAIMRDLEREVEKGVILTKINNPSMAVRQDVIKQLSSGGGSLEHSLLNAGEISQLYTHAVDTDHSLTQKEEAGSLNGALNIKAEAFNSPEFKHPDGTPNYEAREKALEDGAWLTSHGIVTPDGKPNRVMAEKLQQDDARQWQMDQKVQRDKDEDVLEKYSPMLYDPRHPLTIAQIEALPKTDGASSRAVNQLKTALFQEQSRARAMRNEERSLSLAERQQKRRELEDTSIATSLKLADRMANGDVLDYNKDILEPISKGEMTELDGSKVWHMYKDSNQYPQMGEGIGIIAQAYKALPNTPDNNRKAADARDAFLKTVKEKNLHGADILKEAQSIAEQSNQHEANKFINRFMDYFSKGGPVGSASSTPTAPKEGDTKKNSSGDALTYRGGQWVLSQ